MSAVINFPSISDARLPAAYESAKKYLAECVRIDECKDWADKAAALASYAKQAKDETLWRMAVKVQARAIRRCGELMQQIPRGDESTRFGRDVGDQPVITRTQAATEAGLSDRQRKTALRVASVPEDKFDTLMETDTPASVAKLAELGTNKKPQPLIDLKGIPPEDYARATQAQGILSDFAEFSEKHDPKRIANAFMTHEIDDLRRHAAIVGAWLERFVTHLPE